MFLPNHAYCSKVGCINLNYQSIYSIRSGNYFGFPGHRSETMLFALNVFNSHTQGIYTYVYIEQPKKIGNITKHSLLDIRRV